MTNEIQHDEKKGNFCQCAACRATRAAAVKAEKSHGARLIAAHRARLLSGDEDPPGDSR